MLQEIIPIAVMSTDKMNPCGPLGQEHLGPSDNKWDLTRHFIANKAEKYILSIPEGLGMLPNVGLNNWRIFPEGLSKD